MTDIASFINRRHFLQAGAAGALVAVSPRAVFAQGRGRLRIAYGAIGPSRNPLLLSIVPDWDINALVFDMLVLPGENGEPIPGTATQEILRPSPEVIRFKLKPGLTFSDGAPLTAEDVKFSIESYLRKDVLNNYMYNTWLDRVDVVDELTVDLVSKRPYRVALANMAYQSFIVPRTATDLQEFAKAPVGSGPYVIAEAEGSDRILLKPNPSYKRQAAGFQEILFRKIPEDATRVAALLAGEVDFAASVRVEDIDAIKRAGSDVEDISTVRMMFVRFNLGLDGPLRDVRVRRAINHAVDREALQEAFFGGLGAVATAPVAKGARYWADGLPPYEYDVEKAKKLLAEAGQGSGFRIKFVTPMGRYYRDREMAEAIAGQLQDVGITAEIVPLEWATYLQQVRTERETTGKNYALSLMAWGNPILDVDFGVVPFDEVSNAWNVGDYKNPRVQELMVAGRQEFDEAKLKANYDEMQKLIWEDAPWLFLFEMPTVNGIGKAVTGARQGKNETIDWASARPAN
ncbi:MAG: ABC transporter substrate-binding protein [Rhizobiaceae bacterium]